MDVQILPEELLFNVFVSLDAADIVICRRVCKAFKALVDGSSVLKYQVALYFAAYVDGPSNNRLSTAERFRRLESHQDSWNNLKWKRTDSYTIEGKASTYELYGGVYAQGLTAVGAERGNTSWTVTRGMELIEFPSLLRDETESRTWKIKDLGVDVKDFGMDPEKNLLVLMEATPPRTPTDRNPPVSIHLRTLRTTEPIPHPSASKPILTYCMNKYSSSYYYWIQIVGDLLAVLFMPLLAGEPGVNCEITIWNWQTGKLDAKTNYGNAVRVNSFSFISHDTFLVPCIMREEAIGVLRLYKLDRDSQDTTEPQLLCQYSFPENNGISMHNSLMCRTDPSPWAPPPRHPLYKPSPEDEEAPKNDPKKPRPPPPFGPSPSSRIIVLSLQVVAFGHRGGHFEEYTIFVKSGTLLEEWKKHADSQPIDIDDGLPNDPSNPPTLDIPWKSWGPSNTRWTDQNASEDWVCYVYGQRYCRSYPKGDGDFGVEMMDFNETPFKKEILSKNTRKEPPEGPEVTSEDLPPRRSRRHSMVVVVDDPEENEEVETNIIVEDDEEDQDQWITGDDTDDGGDEVDEALMEFSFIPTAQFGVGATIVTKPTIIRSEAFGFPVESKLPFRLTRVDGPEVKDLLRVIIDDERIIGVSRSDDDPQAPMKLTVLTI